MTQHLSNMTWHISCVAYIARACSACAHSLSKFFYVMKDRSLEHIPVLMMKGVSSPCILILLLS